LGLAKPFDACLQANQSLSKSFDRWVLPKCSFGPGLLERICKRMDIFFDTLDAGAELSRLDIDPGKHRIRHGCSDIFGKMSDL